MTNPALLNELRMAQDLVMALVEPLDEKSFRQQYHHELSPIGWHLGHCTYTECYWLQEIVQQDNAFTTPVRELYTPPLIPKPERGKKIPEPAVMLQWIESMQSLNLETLAAPTPGISAHPLMQDDYLVLFLIQHYSQHYENMVMVLTQKALSDASAEYPLDQPLQAKTTATETISIKAGHYRVGGKAPVAYDNELPPQQATLGPFDIAIKPVCNGEFLTFMQEGGYKKQQLWSEPGWNWRQQERINEPQHWRKNTDGNWYGIGLRGGYDLHADDVLNGISHYEAQAYARWAGGHLPHEHQWEVACRLHPLEDTGHAWEWCDNQFYSYEGFTPFPYKEYSQAWFKNNHYSLRGGSLHTQPAIKRPSFRNFYPPDKRHMFAGLRLVYSQ